MSGFVGGLLTAHPSITVCVGQLKGEGAWDIQIADPCGSLGVSVRGCRRPIGQDGAPDVADAKTNVLGDCLVLDDPNGHMYTSRAPLLSAGDELCLLPLDDVIRFMGVFDDR